MKKSTRILLIIASLVVIITSGVTAVEKVSDWVNNQTETESVLESDNA